MDNITTIFTESSEDKGLLYYSYKKLHDIIEDFLYDIGEAIDVFRSDPTSDGIDIRERISDFKKEINIEFSPSPIQIGQTGKIKLEIKKFRDKIQDLMNGYSKLRYKMAYGGNFIHGILFKGKAYSREIDPETYEATNRNMRAIDLALDWVEKALLDVFNMVDQDLNLLTILAPYVNKKIYENADDLISQTRDEEDLDSIQWFDESLTKLCDLINESSMYYAEATSKSDSMDSFMKRWNYDSAKETIKYEDREYRMNLHTDIEKFIYTAKILGRSVKAQGEKELAAVFIYAKEGPIIVVNEAFWNLQPDYQDAVILHEIGHIVCQFSPKPFPKSVKELIARIKKAIQRLMARIRMIKYHRGIHGNGFREMEADIWAAKHLSPEKIKEMIPKIYEVQFDPANVRKMVNNNPQLKHDCELQYKLYKINAGGNAIPYDAFKEKYVRKLIENLRNSPVINRDIEQRIRALNDPKLLNHKYFQKESVDLMNEDIDVYTEDGDAVVPSPPPSLDGNGDKQEPEKMSMPKQTDAAESDKNGVRRKKLYIAFIEWCKAYNSKNVFGSIFDKDAFKITYPFVPDEMRYFYRLANPILCVLGGELTFFQASELRKLNSRNSRLNEMMIFAATPNDTRVFNVKDKKVYRGTEENGQLKLNEVLGSTFDLYIQNMIRQGDILNGPIEESVNEDFDLY